MTDTKLCPLKRGFIGSIADLHSIGITMNEIAEEGIDDRLSSLVSGVCGKEACAWWSAERSRCGVVAGRRK